MTQKEWDTRQQDLRLDIVGHLKQDEIITLERYQSLDPSTPLAEKIKWLGEGNPFEPSLDFEWIVQGGITIEMKRVRRAELQE